MSFLDFCLRCDTQTTGGAYCSQRCRLLDMESSPALYPSFDSPAPHRSDRRGSTSTTSSVSTLGLGGGGGSGFYLPPAFDFSPYRTSTHTTSSSTVAKSRRGPSGGSSSHASTRPRPASVYVTATSNGGSSHHAAATARSVPSMSAGSTSLSRRGPSSPSSSRGSFGSGGASEHGGMGGLSRAVRDELREYGNSFDTVRDLRRRMTMI